jgi:Family of unknown function (DUF5309)
MALPVNTTTTFDRSTMNREDLLNMIYDTSPTETPFISGIKRGKASATLHEWQEDTLAGATTQAYLEGDDATADAFAAPTRLSNRCQIFRKVITVSGTQRAVNSAGTADEYDRLVIKAGKELKRNIEKTLLGTQNKDSPTGTATARALGGVATWLAYNLHKMSSTGTTPGNGTGYVAGTGVTVTTATQLQDPVATVIAQCWNNGGDPSIIMVDSTAKRFLSKITGIATLYRDVPPSSQGQIIQGASVLVSDFGEHTIVPNRFMPSSQIYFLDMQYWGFAELRPIKEVPLAKTGDADRVMLITEGTLECLAPHASGKIGEVLY